jgi:hypothetical protein
MPGLVPGIHVFLVVIITWMAGTGPAMTSSWLRTAQNTDWPLVQQSAKNASNHVARPKDSE